MSQIHIMPFKEKDGIKILTIFMDENACTEFAAGNDDPEATAFYAHLDNSDEVENFVIDLKDGKPVAIRVIKG